MNATLIKMRGSHEVTRAQIAEILPPKATKTWHPVSHTELLEALGLALNQASIKVQSEELAVCRQGLRMFGVMKVDYAVDGNDYGMALGLRQSNDKEVSIQICAGASVLVCDNLVFSGEVIALQRKHTSGLDLAGELKGAVAKLIEHFAALQERIFYLKGSALAPVEAKELLHDAFCKSKIMPIKYLPEVSKNYFTPPHTEFANPTMWSLHNAFTEVAKQMPMTTRFKATQKIGQLFNI